MVPKIHSLRQVFSSRWALALLVFLIPCQQSFVRILSMPHAASTYNWIRFSFFDLLFLILSARVFPKLKIVSQEKESRVLFAFLGLCLLSIFFNSYPILFLPAWSLFKLFLASLLFCALIAESRREPLMTTLQWSLVISGLFQALIALFQFFTHSSVGLKFLGEGKIDPARGLGAFFHAGTSVVVRSKGTLDSPNHLGIFLAAALVALTLLYIKGSARRFLVPTFFILFFALCTTFSRASLFAWALATLLFVLFSRDFAKPILKLALPAVLLCGALLFTQMRERGGIISSTSVNRLADQERVVYLTHACAMIKSHPLRGVGFRNYVAVLDDYAPNTSGPLIVHNIFLLIFAEEGILGLALFLLLFALLLKRAYPRRHDPAVLAWASFLAGLIFYGFCDVFLFSEQQGLLLLFLSFGLLFLSTKQEEALGAK